MQIDGDATFMVIGANAYQQIDGTMNGVQGVSHKAQISVSLLAAGHETLG